MRCPAQSPRERACAQIEPYVGDPGFPLSTFRLQKAARLFAPRVGKDRRDRVGPARGATASSRASWLGGARRRPGVRSQPLGRS